MPPDPAAPLHLCFLETPRLDVYVTVPGLTAAVHTFLNTALRVAVFPAGLRIPLPVPGPSDVYLFASLAFFIVSPLARSFQWSE